MAIFAVDGQIFQNLIESSGHTGGECESTTFTQFESRYTLLFYKTLFQSLNFCSSRCFHIRLSTSLASEQKRQKIVFFHPDFWFLRLWLFSRQTRGFDFLAALGLEFFPYSIAID